MKVAINIQADIQEIEVIINCMAEDENVQRIVSALDSLNESELRLVEGIINAIIENRETEGA